MEKRTDISVRSIRQDNSYPNRMRCLVLLAMEEILGHAGVNEVLQLAGLSEYIVGYLPAGQEKKFPLTQISRLQAGLEHVYGTRAGRGLALRVGRACFRPWLQVFGPELGLTQSDFRLLPLQARLKASTEAFASLFNSVPDQRVCLERDEKYIYWNVEHCPLCWERQSESPSCHLMVGFLQEALYWVSGGKLFIVEEKKCIACGDDTCIVRIDRTPMA